MELKVPKVQLPKINPIDAFLGAVKTTADTATKGASLLDQCVQVKDAVLNANIDEKFERFTDKKKFDEAKKAGRKDIVYLPGPEEKDFTQAKAYLIYGFKLLAGCFAAGAAKLAKKKEEAAK